LAGACDISNAGSVVLPSFPAEITMPILGREPDLYPEDLFSSPLILPQDESWFAMYTMARREKELMRHLRSLKIAHYGPIAAQRTRSPQGRIRVSYVPLFTGYVFVRGDEVQRHDSISTGCVSRCLRVSQPEELVLDLQRVKMMLQQGQDVRPEPKPVVGRTAVIRRGAMTGLRGVVTKVDNAHRLTVIVNFMQQGASMLVDEADVDLE
jgi:transcription antitermination factor NusG